MVAVEAIACVPWLSVTINAGVKEPAPLNVWLGLRALELDPSPKFHEYV